MIQSTTSTVSFSLAHQGALQMASMGVAVFPVHGINAEGHCTCREAGHCNHPGKHPHYMETMNSATTDVGAINEWFQAEPALNYGVRLGREISNTGKMLMVVDVDSYKPGGADALDALEAQHGRLPETAEVISGAGGRHCYYWADSSKSFSGTMGNNIDVKVNGYVVGPGSRHANGTYYEWEASSNPFEGQEIADLPQWVADEFSKAKRDVVDVENSPDTVPLLEHEVWSIKHDLTIISAAVNRAAWLNVLMALHSRSQSVEMFHLADEWSQTCPDKYDAAAVVKAWNSFKPNGGITYDHINGIVRGEIAKSVDLTKLLDNLNRMPISIEVEDLDLHAIIPTSNATAAHRYKMRSAHDFANAPPLQWMIRGLLPQTGLAALYGASGVGKSFVALDLAITVAGAAVEWYGMRVKNCPVTYCVLEGEGGMGKRAKAWEQHHNKALPDTLHFVTEPFNIMNKEDVRELAASILAEGGGNGLIILDTLNRAAPEADENSSKDMGVIIAAAKVLQITTGGLVVVVHHTGKDSERGMRGHSSLFAAMDSVISVSKTLWEVKKSKDDATGTQYKFKLETLTLGVDEEGDEITSCVAVPSLAALALRQSKKLGKHQLIALEVIKGMGSDFMSSVHMDAAVAEVAEKLDVDDKHKRERAKDAIGSLVDLGSLSLKNNYICPV